MKAIGQLAVGLVKWRKYMKLCHNILISLFLLLATPVFAEASTNIFKRTVNYESAGRIEAVATSLASSDYSNGMRRILAWDLPIGKPEVRNIAQTDGEQYNIHYYGLGKIRPTNDEETFCLAYNRTMRSLLEQEFGIDILALSNRAGRATMQKK